MTPNDFERDAIINTQQYLRHLTFHDDRIGKAGSVPIDGIWDEATKNALINFQRSRGLPPTGSVDRDTWELLKAEYEASIAQNSPPTPLSIFPRYPSGFVIKKGDRSYLAATVNHLLRELERLYYFPDLPVEISNVYDDVTALAVSDFQRRNGIKPTGNVDRETWDAMAIQYNLLLDYGE